MAYKPFNGIDVLTRFNQGGVRPGFVYLQEQLAALTIPEADGIQIKNFALPAGWEITDDGSIIPPILPLDYALVCSDTPGATAISPAVLDLSYNFFIEGIMNVCFTADLGTSEHILYRRKTQTDDLLVFGLKHITDHGQCLFLRLGTDEFIGNDPEFYAIYPDDLLNQWHQIGFRINKNNSAAQFFADGWVSKPVVCSPTFPSSTEDLIDLGCAGVRIGMFAFCAMDAEHRWGWNGAEYAYFAPLPKRRPAGAINYYNFAPVVATPGVIPDLALPETYKCELHILSDNATIQASEVI